MLDAIRGGLRWPRSAERQGDDEYRAGLRRTVHVGIHRPLRHLALCLRRGRRGREMRPVSGTSPVVGVPPHPTGRGVLHRCCGIGTYDGYAAWAKTQTEASAAFASVHVWTGRGSKPQPAHIVAVRPPAPPERRLTARPDPRKEAATTTPSSFLDRAVPRLAPRERRPRPTASRARSLSTRSPTWAVTAGVELGFRHPGVDWERVPREAVSCPRRRSSCRLHDGWCGEVGGGRDLLVLAEVVVLMFTDSVHLGRGTAAHP